MIIIRTLSEYSPLSVICWFTFLPTLVTFYYFSGLWIRLLKQHSLSFTVIFLIYSGNIYAIFFKINISFFNSLSLIMNFFLQTCKIFWLIIDAAHLYGLQNSWGWGGIKKFVKSLFIIKLLWYTFRLNPLAKLQIQII